ncbi:hypothetical protein Dimus_017557 [Dionaea muscipula]
MSPPSLNVEGEVQIKLVPSLLQPVKSCYKERNYFELSDCSSVDSSSVTSFQEDKKGHMNLKSTELRLGLPGSQSPERDAQLFLLSSRKLLDERPLFPLAPLKDIKTGVSGNKRGFSDTTSKVVVVEKTCTEGNWMLRASSPSSDQGKFPVNGGMNAMLSSRPSLNSGVKSYAVKELSGAHQGLMENMASKSFLGSGVGGNSQMDAANSNNCAPAAKAQVVGWPPIRSFRKNTLATTSKNNDEVDGKPGFLPLLVKVSMDGVPYLRKVDLRIYSTYQELSVALEKMFSCFTLGQCGSNEAFEEESVSKNDLKDLLHGSEYVLAYEDKDGDWMLVGDVPWELFTDSCKRLKIMKSTDAIGLAPRFMNKSKNRN